MSTALLEETHEVIEAIQNQNPESLKEELGDLLFVLLLTYDIAKKKHGISTHEIIDSIVKKMIRRHPHIFAPDKPQLSWDEIKRQEKQHAHRSSLLDGIPKTLPALSYAEKQGRKAAKIGFDWPNIEGVLSKIDEEIAELKDAIQNQNPAAIQHELGDVLMSCTNLSRKLGFSSELALRKANRRFSRRFQWMEQYTPAPLDSLSSDELEELWFQAKKQEPNIDT